MFLMVLGSIMIFFITLEAFLYPRLLKKSYPWKDGLSAIAVTIGNQLSQFIYALIPTYIFSYFYDIRLYTIPITKWWHYALLFLLVDFSYYWGHRLAHHVRWMWASHSVHHSPNHLTLATAYQLAWTAWLSGEWLLWIPFILIGLDPTTGIEVMTLSLLYQFWLHTELVPRTRFLGLLFNTPAAHRIHHASNPEYINKNFGGVLIIFDVIFGTYQSEIKDLQIRYGLSQPLQSLNPIHVALHEWKILFREIIQTPDWTAKVRLCIEDPATTYQRQQLAAVGHRVKPAGSDAELITQFPIELPVGRRNWVLRSQSSG